MNLAEHLEHAALLHARRPAIRDGATVVDHRTLSARSARAAVVLGEAGVDVDDRVVLLLPHTADFAVWYYAVLRRGAIAVALDPAAPLTAQHRQIGEVDAALVVAWSPSPTLALPGHPVLDAAGLDLDLETDLDDAAAVPRTPDDLAVVVYTSGTTAPPKPTVLTHGNLVHDARQVAVEVLELTQDDVVLGMLPFHGAYGQTCVLNAAVLAGASIVLAPREEPDLAADLLLEHGVTVLIGVPSMMQGLLATPTAAAGFPGARVRVCLCGGAALPLGLLLDLERRLDCVVLEGYGLSEAAPVVAANRIDRRRLGSVGLPLAGVEVRVAPSPTGETGPDAVGEVLVGGRTVMAGYWGPGGVDDAPLADGWLHTGDLGHRDADGFLHVLDRAAEVMWRSGRAVYPRAIEQILYDHPDVREAAVVEVPVERAGGGEPDLVAFVVLEAEPWPSGGSARPADLLRDLSRQLGRLPAHARPTRVEITAALPKTRTGKILKRALRTAVQA